MTELQLQWIVVGTVSLVTCAIGVHCFLSSFREEDQPEYSDRRRAVKVVSEIFFSIVAFYGMVVFLMSLVQVFWP